MRWAIIRLIWLRELRDQLRDRRTLLMILGLPLFVYPTLGFAVLHLASGFATRDTVLGIVRVQSDCDDFPFAHPSLEPTAYTPLVKDGTLAVSPLANAPNFRIVLLDELDHSALEERRVDLLISSSRDFLHQLESSERTTELDIPRLQVLCRPQDDASYQAYQRFIPALQRWKTDLMRIRLERQGLPVQFDHPFGLLEPDQGSASGAGRDRLFDMTVRLFPFLLVMWSLAGALYPAVDLCAGEKERGTMETLLITPAGREEIVLGKFLTIWVFSFATALVNLASMGCSTAQFLAERSPTGGVPLTAMLWSVVLSLPLSALFSAVSLAIGAYARSSKEGQYYLMPLFVLSMPLAFLTLAPGVELNPLYSLIPITGVSLLMQKLMTDGLTGSQWIYFPSVLAPIVVYSWMALRWAIGQFQREEVLFREAERIDWALWLRRLFREKEPLPTFGQAIFCFGLVVGLRWLMLRLGGNVPLEVITAVASLAFVATPPLFMALLLNTMPRQAFFLQWPYRRDTWLGMVLALLLLPPMIALAQHAFSLFPTWTEDRHPWIQILAALVGDHESAGLPVLWSLLTLALVPAIAEELAFRGFILTGLHRHGRPRDAIVWSAFLFALFHLNVFLFLPAFILGIVLGLLTVRSRSILPAIVFHFLFNGLLILLVHLRPWSAQHGPWLTAQLFPVLVSIGVMGGLGVSWWLYRKPYLDMARSRRVI